MTPKAKRELLERLNAAFESEVAEVQRPKMRQFIQTINEEIIETMPRSAREIRDIVRKHTISNTFSIKMFTVLQGVTAVIMGRPTLNSKVREIEALMKTYTVMRPKAFAKSVRNMTTGRAMSGTQQRFRPILLSYYDGFTETIETVEQQTMRALHRTQVESKSRMFRDIEELREQRIPLRRMKNILKERYLDDLRVDVAVETELHEQAERVKLEGSKFMGYTHKEWVTQGDERVRKTRFHQHVEGKIVPIDSDFRAGGLVADYPSDPRLPVGERIRCRCYVIYHNSPNARVRTSNIPTP